MILVASQRAGGSNLARHLLSSENEHVSVHELRGFVSNDLHGAFNEARAISRGTQCKQYLFSLSLNPPPQENVPIEDFEKAIAQVENKLGLEGQPRAIVFHEKQGRRHAHAVWSRIKADEMKAVQLSFSKRKLQEVSRELYLEHGWKMPKGLMQSGQCDPRNFTLEQWQQAKRINKDPRQIMAGLRECWAISDNRASFIAALNHRGYLLAKGDRRDFVAVDMQGEVYALNKKWLSVKAKEIRDRLGEAKDLPYIAQRKEELAVQISRRLHSFKTQQQKDHAEEQARLEAERNAMTAQHQKLRAQMSAMQQARWQQENILRQQRFKSGFRGFFDRMTGQQHRIQSKNEAEALQALHRDRKEKDALIFKQLEERRILQTKILQLRQQHQQHRQAIKSDIRVQETNRVEAKQAFKEQAMPNRKKLEALRERRQNKLNQRQNQGPEFKL